MHFYRIVVCASCADCNGVPYFAMLNRHVFADKIAAFAALSGNGNRICFRLICLICNECIIGRLVQNIPRIVTHTAVNGNIGADVRDHLNAAYGVQCDAGRRCNGATRFNENKRPLYIMRCAEAVDYLCNGFHICIIRQRIVFLGIANAKAAAQVQILCLIVQLMLQLFDEFHHDFCRSSKALCVQNLRTNVAVQAAQFQVRIRQRLLYCLICLTGFQRKSELAVNLAGADEIMGVRIYTRLDAEQNRGSQMLFSCQLIEVLHLIDIVYHNAANAIVQRHRQFFGSLVVAVEASLGYIKACLHSSVQLAAGNNIDSHMLALHNTVDFLAGKRLAGIAHQTLAVIVFLDTLLECAAVTANHIFVHDIQRRAILLCQSNRIYAANGQMAFGIGIQIF